MAHQWLPRARDYAKERAQNSLPRSPTTEHPLAPKKETTGASKTKSEPVAHPLAGKGEPSLPAFVDPLLQPSLVTPTTKAFETSTPKPVGEEEQFVPWSARKKDILHTYTTDEVVGIQASFMDTQSRVNLPVDKQKQRLEALEDSEEALEKEILKVSQRDYIGHIEKLHDQLIKAWDTEERVKTLKIAIQCAKVLSDTSVIKFYPSKWVLITEILDTFGRLVYERIYERAQAGDATTGGHTRLPENFSPKDVPESARETCRNWFFKIASIRELLPRLYVELAIIKCYCFLSKDSYREVINRLTMMARGVGDPLVAMYTRAYIARKAREIAPQLREHLITSFNDYLYAHQVVIKRPQFLKSLEDNHLTMGDYIHLYSPALEWLLQCIAFKADKSVFNSVLAKYTESGNSLVLNHIISSFHPNFISANARSLAALIKDSDGQTFAKYKLYYSFGVCLALSTGPSEEDKLALLNDVWKVVTKFKDPKEYMTVAEAFIDYPLAHCSPREVNTLLADVLKHVKEEKAYEALQPQLQSLVQKILAKYHDFAIIFGMNNFLPVLDLFVGNTQVEINKAILSSFAKYQNRTRDPVIINCMFGVSKIVHDALNALSFQDEVRQISHLISRFITKIDFGREVIKHLDFFVECRRAFANLDAVKADLVLGVCALAMRTLSLANGTHSKKTAAFVRACVAYCFITIPSMSDVFQRLYLYLASGQVALLNQCLPQAESLFKAAITLLQEVPPHMQDGDGREVSTEEAFVSYITNFASVLLVAPGHPEHGAFYLIKGLLHVVLTYTWMPSSPNKAIVLTRLLAYFAAASQPSLPYHVAKLDSNDVLYAGEEALKTELLTITDKLVDLILEQLQLLKSDQGSQSSKHQVTVALYLFEHTVRLCALNAKTATLTTNLYQLARKYGASKEELTRCRKLLADGSDPFLAEVMQRCGA